MKICNLKIDVSCEASVNFQHIAQNATTATEFAPCRHLTQALPKCDLQKNTQHDTSKVLCLPRKMTMDTSKVLRLPRNLPRIFAKRRKSIAPATQNDFRHVTERCWMSRSATPATRNEATRRLKPPKMIPPAELPIGTAIRSSHERLRTVADGCERLRTVATVKATSSEHTLPQSETGTLATHSGKHHHPHQLSKTIWAIATLPISADLWQSLPSHTNGTRQTQGFSTDLAPQIGQFLADSNGSTLSTPDW